MDFITDYANWLKTNMKDLKKMPAPVVKHKLIGELVRRGLATTAIDQIQLDTGKDGKVTSMSLYRSAEKIFYNLTTTKDMKLRFEKKQQEKQAKEDEREQKLIAALNGDFDEALGVEYAQEKEGLKLPSEPESNTKSADEKESLFKFTIDKAFINEKRAGLVENVKKLPKEQQAEKIDEFTNFVNDYVANQYKEQKAKFDSANKKGNENYNINNTSGFENHKGFDLNLQLDGSFLETMQGKDPSQVRQEVVNEIYNQAASQQIDPKQLTMPRCNSFSQNTKNPAAPKKTAAVSGKSILDTLADSVMADMYNTSKKNLLATPQEEQQLEGSPQKAPKSRTIEVDSKGNVTETQRESSMLSVDNVVDFYLTNGKINPEHEEVLKKNGINGLEELEGMIPQTMMNGMSKHDD